MGDPRSAACKSDLEDVVEQGATIRALTVGAREEEFNGVWSHRRIAFSMASTRRLSHEFSWNRPPSAKPC